MAVVADVARRLCNRTVAATKEIGAVFSLSYTSWGNGCVCLFEEPCTASVEPMPDLWDETGAKARVKHVA